MACPALPNTDAAAAAAASLAGHPDYRVLRRFTGDPAVYLPQRTPIAGVVRTGIFVDVETTGVDPQTAEIIEFALVPFNFDDAGILFVGAGCSWLQQPSTPIPAEVVRLTGITDEMVNGRQLDEDAILAWLKRAVIVLAHNAEFDRQVTERRFPAFAESYWACTYREVPWDEFGSSSGRLVHIMSDVLGLFYSAHRATDDCHAGLAVLANAQLSDRTAFSYLIESARQPSFRVFAMKAAYEHKGRLKARRYRWDNEAGVWWREVRVRDVATERAWLASECGVRNPPVVRLTARDRWSVRAQGVMGGHAA